MPRPAAIPTLSCPRQNQQLHPAQGVRLCLPRGREPGLSTAAVGPTLCPNLQAELSDVQPLGKLHGVHALLSPGTAPWPSKVTVRCCEL